MCAHEAIIVGEVTLSRLVSRSSSSDGSGYQCLSITKIDVLAWPARCRGYTPIISHNHNGKVIAEACDALGQSPVIVRISMLVRVSVVAAVMVTARVIVTATVPITDAIIISAVGIISIT